MHKIPIWPWQARLQSSSGYLIYAGTSDTLGNRDETALLLGHSRWIFGAIFLAEAVSTESLKTIGAFLESVTVDFLYYQPEQLSERLQNIDLSTPDQTVADWFGLFFPDEPALKDVSNLELRIQLDTFHQRRIVWLIQNTLIKIEYTFRQNIKRRFTGLYSYLNIAV